MALHINILASSAYDIRLQASLLRYQINFNWRFNLILDWLDRLCWLVTLRVWLVLLLKDARPTS